MEYIEDVCQTRKVRHKRKVVLVIVLFATLADRRYILAESKKEWSGLKTIFLTGNTITGAEESVEERYFISSLPLGIEEIEHAVKGIGFKPEKEEVCN